MPPARTQSEPPQASLRKSQPRLHSEPPPPPPPPSLRARQLKRDTYEIRRQRRQLDREAHSLTARLARVNDRQRLLVRMLDAARVLERGLVAAGVEAAYFGERGAYELTSESPPTPDGEVIDISTDDDDDDDTADDAILDQLIEELFSGRAGTPADGHAPSRDAEPAADVGGAVHGPSCEAAPHEAPDSDGAHPPSEGLKASQHPEKSAPDTDILGTERPAIS